MALMLGALTIQGIQPGPQVMTQKPDLFWGLIASMWIGNAMLVVLNLPLIGLWVKLLKVPYRLLFPAIMAFSAIGIFSVQNSSFEIHLTALFGVLGFIWMRLGFPLAPMLLGFVLGPMMEEYLRRAMLMSGGDPRVFITRPISRGVHHRHRPDPDGDDRARGAQAPRSDYGLAARRLCLALSYFIPTSSRPLLMMAGAASARREEPDDRAGQIGIPGARRDASGKYRDLL